MLSLHPAKEETVTAAHVTQETISNDSPSSVPTSYDLRDGVCGGVVLHFVDVDIGGAAGDDGQSAISRDCWCVSMMIMMMMMLVVMPNLARIE